MIIPMMTSATTIRAGIKSFFRPNVTVISLEVRGFPLRISLSVEEMLFSILSSSDRTSPAL